MNQADLDKIKDQKELVKQLDVFHGYLEIFATCEPDDIPELGSVVRNLVKMRFELLLGNYSSVADLEIRDKYSIVLDKVSQKLALPPWEGFFDHL